MFTSYKNALYQSLEARKDNQALYFNWLLPWVTVFVAVAILIALFKGPGHQMEYHFYDERGLITALSSVFLAMAGAFAGASFLLEKNKFSRLGIFWLFVFVGFMFFAIDELMQFHEKLGRYIDTTDLGPQQHFRNWNDVIVISYGLVALIVGLYFLPVILRVPVLPEVLACAFGFFVIHTLIDSLVYTRTTSSTIFEESAKLYCSSYIAVAMLYGLMYMVEKHKKH